MLYLDILYLAYRTLPVIVIILLISLICSKKTVISAVPKKISRINSEKQETCEWLTALLDRVFEGIVGDLGDTLKSALEVKIDHLLESKGYVRESACNIESLGRSLPKLVAINIIKGDASEMKELYESKIDRTIRELPSVPKSSSMEANVIELECEVEYNGGFCASISAKIPVVRGRILPCEVGIRDISFSAHVWLRLTCYDGQPKEKLNNGHNGLDVATVPTIIVEMNCISDPSYTFKLETEIGAKYILKNFSLVNYGIHYVLKNVLQRYVVLPAKHIVFELSLPYIGEMNDCDGL